MPPVFVVEVEVLRGQCGAREYGELDAVGEGRLQYPPRPPVREVQLGQVGVVGGGREDAHPAPPPPRDAPDLLLKAAGDVEVLSPLPQLRAVEGTEPVF
jgi:hypothetical protein